MKIKIIPPNRGDEILDLEFDECPDLKFFQDAVGGLIEVVKVESNGVRYKQLIVNEEGLLHNLDLNVNLGPYLNNVETSGIIVGTAVLIEEGELD
jgi:hypothetical protein